MLFLSSRNIFQFNANPTRSQTFQRCPIHLGDQIPDPVGHCHCKYKKSPHFHQKLPEFNFDSKF